MYRAAGITPAPSTEPRTEQDVAASYVAYVDALKSLAAAVDGWQTRLDRIPVMPKITEELAAMSACMGFLLERRSQLRRTVHPHACQYDGTRPVTEMRADHADQTLAFYEQLFGGLLESPECWTLRDEPAVMEETMTMAIADLHHLADGSEVSWPAVLRKAQEAYEVNLAEGS